MDNATKIQAVINTIEMLNIPSSYDNVNRLLGIFQTLVEVRDSLKMAEVATDDGKTDSE